MHATITTHAIWGCACSKLQHSQPQIACVVIVACIELPQTVYIIACVRAPRSRAHMLCASDAFKASERAQTRVHAFAHVERMRSHANAKTSGCACRNLRHAQPQVFAHVGARSTHANACDRAPSWPWRTLAIVRVELGEHWRAFNARVGTRWRFT